MPDVRILGDLEAEGPTVKAEHPVKESIRYITGRCPVCNVMSPVCDQQEDIRRETISNWWFRHFDSQHRFGPIFERAKPPEGQVGQEDTLRRGGCDPAPPGNDGSPDVDS
jgi:hypothetical protein